MSYTHTHTHTHRHICTHIHTHARTYRHTHKHTHILTHGHAHTRKPGVSLRIHLFLTVRLSLSLAWIWFSSKAEWSGSPKILFVSTTPVPGWGIANMCHHAWLSYLGSGTPTQDSACMVSILLTDTSTGRHLTFLTIMEALRRENQSCQVALSKQKKKKKSKTGTRDKMHAPLHRFPHRNCIRRPQGQLLQAASITNEANHEQAKSV